MSSPQKISSEKLPRTATNDTAANDSLIKQEIDQIEESAQSHNVVIIQKQLNAKRWRDMKPKAIDERLYYHDKEHREEVHKELEKAREDELSRLAAESDQHAPTGINPHSLELTSKIDQDFLERTREWDDKKKEKLAERRTEQEEQTKKDLQDTIEFRSFVNRNFDRESRVKEFVGALDQIAEYKKTQRNLYGKSQDKSLRGGAARSKSPAPGPKVPGASEGEDIQKKVRFEVKVSGAAPSFKGAVVSGKSKSPMRLVPVPVSENWKKTKLVEFKGALKEAIHDS